jgi:arabinose-5-phosphate isomerase
MSFHGRAREIIDREVEALRHMATCLDSSFDEACQQVLDTKGRVIVSGVGKSGIIGRKIAATLASTGTPAFFLHAAEALHGDLGMVTPDDLVILITHSGETAEVLHVASHLSEMKIPLIIITGRPDSSIGLKCISQLITGVSQEADSLGLAPSCSTTASLVLGDALALCVSEARGFGRVDFARCHPGGNLGQMLAKDKER